MFIVDASLLQWVPNVRILVLGLILLGSGCRENSSSPDTQTVSDNDESSSASKVVSSEENKEKGNQWQGAETEKETKASPPIPDALVFEAALNGDVKTIEQAVKEKTEYGLIDENGRTPLMLAAFNGHTQIVELLLTAGMPVDLKDETGRTALMYGSTGPNPETVHLLIKNGADANTIDGHEHWTPLMFAAAEGHESVVNVLLDAEADPDMKDIDGETAADFADQRGHKVLAEKLRSMNQPKKDPPL